MLKVYQNNNTLLYLLTTFRGNEQLKKLTFHYSLRITRSALLIYVIYAIDRYTILDLVGLFYIMPGIPPPMPPIPPISGIPPSSDGRSATTASVVKNIAATDAACCNAERVTLVGSTIPASTMFTHSLFAASNPVPTSSPFRRSTMIEPSNPAFSAI